MTASEKTPSRHDGVTITCPACGGAYVALGRQRWCSEACRSAGYRQRRQAMEPLLELPVPSPRRARSVYQCDTCDARALGEQRCEACGTFMRRIGFGGLCPCCDEPVAAIELVPEAKERHV